MAYLSDSLQNGAGSAGTGGTMTLRNSQMKKNCDQKSLSCRTVLTLGGLYGMIISVLGLVVPFTYFLNLWAKQEFHYYYVFYGYIILVSLGFIIYVSVKTRQLRGSAEEKSEPNVILTGEGVNVYLTFAIVVFGALAILHQILIFVAYGEDPLQKSCYGYGQIVTSALIILFIFSQMVFFLGHSKTVFNFKPTLMKIGFIHLMASNICTWSLAIIFEAGESYLHSYGEHQESGGHDTSRSSAATERHARAVANESDRDPSSAGHSNQPFVLMCLGLKTTAMRASPYLIPFLIEFSLVAVSILYGMFTNVDSKPPSHRLKLINKKDAETLNQKLCTNRIGVRFFHHGLVSVTIAVTVCYALILEDVIDVGEYYATATTVLFFGIQYVLLALSIIFTICAAYHTRKCHYIPKSGHGFFDLVLLTVSLGGFYFLLSFVIIVSLDSISSKQDTSSRARLYLGWAFLSYIQSTMQVGFVRDGFRRVALTRSTVTNYVSRKLIIMNAACNESLWVVMSFMLKEMASEPLMTNFYSSITWIVITSVFLPLAIFFRFHTGSCLAEIIEGLYHGTCFIGKRQINAKRWEHKE